jgi:hypothetical protein
VKVIRVKMMGESDTILNTKIHEHQRCANHFFEGINGKMREIQFVCIANVGRMHRITIKIDSETLAREMKHGC